MVLRLKKIIRELPSGADFFCFTRAGRLPFVRRKGQTVVEYLLMLATVAAIAIIIGILFYKKILGGFFTLVGMIIGAGTPTT